jgi:hypothetical protein
VSEVPTTTDHAYVLYDVLDLYEQGSLTAEQAMTVLRIDTGRTPRSEASKALGRIIQDVTNGHLPVSALTAAIEEVPGQ